MEDIDIEWIQRDVLRKGANVHLCRTVLRGKRVNMSFKTLFLKNGAFDPTPRRWGATPLKAARLRAISFIEQNQTCFLSGDKLLLKPQRRSPVELLASLVQKVTTS